MSSRALTFIFLVAFAMPSFAQTNCGVLAVLANGPREEYAPKFVASYRAWLGSDLANSLTPSELAGLAANPFHLIEGESGRAETRALLAEFEGALALLDPAERATVTQAMRAIVSERLAPQAIGEARKESERAKTAVGRIAGAAPFASVEVSGTLGKIVALAGGRDFIFSHSGAGSFDVPLREWRRTTSPSDDHFLLSFDTHWFLKVPRSNALPTWTRAGVRDVPGSLPPLTDEVLNRFHHGNSIEGMLFSGDGSKILFQHNDKNHTIYSLPYASSDRIKWLTRRDALLGVARDGQSVWLTADTRVLRIDARDQSTRQSDFQTFRHGSALAHFESPDGKTLYLIGESAVMGVYGPRLMEFDLETMKLRSERPLPPHTKAEFTRDGSRLLLVDASEIQTRATLWSMATNSPMAQATWSGMKGEVSLSPEGKELLVALLRVGRPITSVRAYRVEDWIGAGRIYEEGAP